MLCRIFLILVFSWRNRFSYKIRKYVKDFFFGKYFRFFFFFLVFRGAAYEIEMYI